MVEDKPSDDGNKFDLVAMAERSQSQVIETESTLDKAAPKRLFSGQFAQNI